MRGGDFGEVAMRAAVDVGDGDDVRTCGEGLQYCCCCGGAGGECEGVAGVFERCDGFFEVVPIHPRILALRSLSRMGEKKDLPVGIRAASVLINTNWFSDTRLRKCR